MYHQKLLTHKHPNTINKNDEIRGHIPLKMLVLVSKFLKWRRNKGKTDVKGKRVNREAGHGLEIPCQYKSVCKESFNCRCQKTQSGET